MDPNREFKRNKHPYASPRPERWIIMIRCDRTNCGHKMKITRDTWVSDEVIVCPNCGETSYWGTL